MKDVAAIDLKDYRQPLITSLGIIIGFLLGFLGQWVVEDTFSLSTAGDKIAFIGCASGIAILLFALFRMLWPLSGSQDVVATYKSILITYALGVVVALSCILLSAFF